MVGGAHYEACDMWHGKSDEGYGTAIGCRRSCKDACGDEQPTAYAVGVDAEVGGVAFAKQQGVEGFDEQDAEQQSQDADDGEEGQLAERDVGEAAHAPHDVAVQVVGIGKDVEQHDD